MIQIAAPGTLSNAAKKETVMSAVSTSKTATNNTIECVLSASDSYIETLSFQGINAQPGLVELVIRTQLLIAKNPAEKRVKSRTCVPLAQIAEMRNAIDQFLKISASSPHEPAYP